MSRRYDTGEPGRDTGPGRVAPIEMTPAAFRDAGHRLVDRIADFLEDLPLGPVVRARTQSEVRALLPQGGIPEQGTAPGDLLDEAARLLFEHSLFNGHPKFFGYITSSAAPIGALGDLLAAAVNPNMGAWELSPVASEIELQAVRWIAEMLGLPDDSGGLMVSGGNMANFVCFLAARRARCDASIRVRGLEAAGGRLLVYASDDAHTWLEKATDLFGHGTDSIRRIPAARDRRLDVGALRRMVADDRAAGHRPFLIIGTAGTVGTGAVEPLPELAAAARDLDLWFHVDGAYGALAAVAPGAPAELAAQAQADSIAVDPHKWLYTPLEAGCALVRRGADLPAAFRYSPSYYSGMDGKGTATDFHSLGMQNSRGFRALKVWLGLRQIGRAGYAATIGEDMRLARVLFAAIDAEPELEALTCHLSIVTFRYVPAGDSASGDARERRLDRLNRALRDRLRLGGEVFVSNAVVDGRFLLRACIVNFRTSEKDVREIPGIVVRYGRQAVADGLFALDP